jgi:hypothetical protein
MLNLSSPSTPLIMAFLNYLVISLCVQLAKLASLFIFIDLTLKKIDLLNILKISIFLQF